MNDSSIFTANGMTHFKIIAVSLIASITVVAIGATARPTAPHTTRARNHAPVVPSPVKPAPSMIASGVQATDIN
jgi:hypothetical protein